LVSVGALRTWGL